MGAVENAVETTVKTRRDRAQRSPRRRYFWSIDLAKKVVTAAVSK